MDGGLAAPVMAVLIWTFDATSRLSAAVFVTVTGKETLCGVAVLSVMVMTGLG